jgi:hypothetical protein
MFKYRFPPRMTLCASFAYNPSTFRYSHRTFKQLTDDELFDEMRTRSFPGFDDDFADIIAPEAAAAAAAATQSSASSASSNASVGWFQDDDVEQIYNCLLLSLQHHSVPPVVDAGSVRDAVEAATRCASHFGIMLPTTSSVNMAFFIASRQSHASLTTAPLLTEVPSNINIFKETAIAEVEISNYFKKQFLFSRIAINSRFLTSSPGHPL